jgi:uncharacterized iron-regulated protein
VGEIDINALLADLERSRVANSLIFLLSLNEKKQIPQEFRVPAGAHRHFGHLLGEHPGMNQHDLPRFFAAQNLWGQTMARTILEFRKKNVTSKLLILTGRAHVQGEFGIPDYVRQKSICKAIGATAVEIERSCFQDPSWRQEMTPPSLKPK